MSVPVLTHRRDLRPGDLIFPEEILRIGRTLDFLLGCVKIGRARLNSSH